MKVTSFSNSQLKSLSSSESTFIVEYKFVEDDETWKPVNFDDYASQFSTNKFSTKEEAEDAKEALEQDALNDTEEFREFRVRQV